jgi:RhoGEF domain
MVKDSINQSIDQSIEGYFFLQKITPFENFDEAEQAIADLLQLPVQRVAEYQNFIQELIKYTVRAKQDVSGLQKTLDMLLGVPHRAHDIELLKSIKGYRGNIHKLGRIIRHDPVVIWEDADPKKKGKDRHLFLFKDRILVTKMVRAESAGGAPPQFNNKGVIQVGSLLPDGWSTCCCSQLVKRSSNGFIF